ncbi:MAG: phosphatase PAP2 family protein [Bdellovibrio sp.]
MFIKVKFRFILFFSICLTIVFVSSKSKANFFDEQVYPVFEPQETDHTKYLWMTGAAAVGILAVQSIDGDIKSRYGDHQLMPAWQSRIGDQYVSYGGNILIAVGQLIWDRDNGINHTRALLFTFAATHTLKYLILQERPDGSDHYAMPSGHTSTAFATATSLTMAYGWKVGVPAYAMATFTGLSRINDDRHWGSNVMAGALLGILIGKATFFKNKEEGFEARSKVDQKFALIPAYDDKGFSLNFIKQF